MKTSFLLAGALLLSAPVLAQQAPPTPATEPTGFDLLVQAGNKILPGPNGVPSAMEELTAVENLRRQRLAVERNASALALVRKALKKPINVPLAVDYKNPGLSAAGKVRELSRQFWQESDVRLADGNFVGAMNSRLDIIEMGVAFERGNFISMLTGAAIESVGRKDIEKIISHLDAAQCRTAAARLKTIEERRPSYPEVVQQEQLQTETLLLSTLPDLQKAILTEEGRKNNEIDEAAAARIAALTPDKLRSDVNAVFVPILETAGRAYDPSLDIAAPEGMNSMLQGTLDILGKPQARFGYERARTANLLLIAALELRAQKLESGVYPDTFVTLADPFSPDSKPLVYKKTPQGYLLYSVGPDGKDNDGAEPRTVIEGAEPGNETVTNRLDVDSTGDVVQEAF